jgi:hypothetical protein
MGCPTRIRASNWPMGGSDWPVGGSRTVNRRYWRTGGTRSRTAEGGWPTCPSTISASAPCACNGRKSLALSSGSVRRWGDLYERSPVN